MTHGADWFWLLSGMGVFCVCAGIMVRLVTKRW